MKGGDARQANVVEVALPDRNGSGGDSKGNLGKRGIERSDNNEQAE